LLPVMAYLTYKLLEKKDVLFICIALYVVLLQSFIPSYYWQWSQGQEKVLQTFMLLFSFYLGKTSRNVLSGIVFGLSFFDPRFALIATPLFMLYNRPKLKISAATAALTCLASNLILFYPEIWSGFWPMLINYGFSTPIYIYSFIPILTICIFLYANAKEFFSWFGYPWSAKPISSSATCV
jgi:hypothetical protein